MKQIVVWGTGRDGQEAYDFFGDNLIFCYIDSDRQKQGAKFNGIDILSPDCLKDMDLNKYEFVVAIFRNVFMTYSVVNKLRKHGIDNCWIWQDIKKYYSTADEFMQRQDNIGRQECISEIYKNQLDYVVRHTKVNRAGYYREQIQNVLNGVSANELLPATGNVRKHQLWKLDLAYQFVQRLNTELGISAPLTTGSLLGAARHGGFIPWDDDIDFALLSKDYKKFLDYALEATDIDLFFRNLENDLEVVTDTDGNRYEDKGSHKQYLALHGFGWCTLFYNLGASNIHENLPIADICPIYFYDKSWTVERYNDEVLNRVYQLQNKIEFSDDIDCTIDTPLEDLIQTGGRVGYGLNMAARISYWGLFHGRSRPFDSKIWDAADYFPIKDMRFEDKTFAVPNKYDKLLMQEYGENYMDIPLQVGILIHDKERLFNEYY